LFTIILGTAIVSAGVAFALAAMPTLITESAPLDQTASANSVNSLLRSVGTSTGSAVAAAVLASSTVLIGAAVVPTLHSFEVLYSIGAGAAFLAAIVTLVVRVERKDAVQRDRPGVKVQSGETVRD
jgi:MFS family permease